MNRDGRDSDDADWLLAQLVSGRPPAPQDPSVAAPPAAAPPAAVTPPPAVTPPSSPAAPPAPPPLREEVLDWFSLAEPETAPDVATRALPIIGGPPMAGHMVPPVAGMPPTAAVVPPAAFPVAPPAAPTGLPSWNPPFMVGRPDNTVPHVTHPSTSPLKTVEPPVGDAPRVADAHSRPDVPTPPAGPASAPAPAPQPPVADEAPVAPMPPVAPVAPVTPPGPVTPTAPFALTWGGGELDSEDAIRAAFRSLAGAGSTPPASPSPLASDANESAAGQATPPVTPAEVPRDSVPTPDVDPAPFTDLTPPPVARQSFTPVTHPTPTPPRHPIAPTTAPAGWDERPAQPAPQKDFDDELWSALTEAAAPVPPAAAPVPPAAAPAPPAAAPLPPVAAPVPPAAAPAPPAAAPAPPTVAPAPPVAPVPPAAAPMPPAAAPAPPTAPVPPAAAPMPPAPPVATPPAAAPNHSNEANGFPFIEVRGDAGSSASALDTPVESAVHNRLPYPAFASTGGDDRSRRPDSQPEPVDDLLAALGAGTARPSRDEEPGEPASGQGGGSGTPPERGGTPPSTPGEDPLDALRLAFQGDADDLDHDDDPDTGAEPAAGGVTREGDSPIAREIAETGYFWNLTPDPSAPDPKADPAPPAAADVPSPSDRPSPFAAEEVPPFAEFEPEPAPEPAFGIEAEPDPEPDTNWQFGGDELTSMFPPASSEPVAPTAAQSTADPANSSLDDDPLASLFGAASAPAAAASPAAPAWPAAAPAATGAALGSAGSAGTATRAPSSPPLTAGSGGSGRGAPSGSSGASGGSGGNRTVRTLLWIAGGLVVAVVIAGLFFLGMQLPFGGGEAPSPSAEPGVTEEPVAEPTAQQPVGVHAWNALFGGECIDPFVSVWEEEFTVVDCAAPHAAQLVYRGELAADAAAPFPGEAEVGAQTVAACTADGVIDVGLVAGIPDLQVQGAYPVTEEQWTNGERTFYCFANRAGGEALTGSIAGPGPAA